MNHLPPWLRNLPLPPNPAAAASESPAAAPFASDTPDWLQDLEQEAGRMAPTDAAESTSASDTPDWLRDLAEEADQLPPPDSNSALRSAQFGATDWLRSIGADESSSSQQTEPPAPADEPPPTTTSRIRMPVGATDWLRSIGQETELEDELEATELAQSGGDEDDPEVPDWLHDVNPDELISTSEAEQMAGLDADDPHVPDWLRDSNAAEADRSTVAADPDPLPLEETIASSDDVPDWLREIVPAEDLSAAEARRERDAAPSWLQDVSAGDDSPVAGADVPDWLRQVGGDEGSASDSGGDVPAWLRDAESGSPTDEAGGDVPAWLRDTGDTPPAAPADDVPAWLRDTDDTPPAAPADDVPAWLRDTGDTPPAAPPQQFPAAESSDADEVPDWLREVEATQKPQKPEIPAASPAVDSGEMPAWMRGEEEPADSAEMPAWMRGEEEPADAAPTAESARDDMPPWLRDEEAPVATPPPAPAAGGNLPDWLADDESSAAQPARPGTGELSLPSWLRGVTDEAPPPAAPPVRPQRPPDEPPRRSVKPADDEGNDFLGGADLPSWLRPNEPERPTDTSDAQTLDWLSRLGAADQEENDEQGPAAVATIAPPPSVVQRSAEQITASRLLGQLVRAPYPEPAPAAEAAPLTRWQRIGLDRVLYLVLALAVLVGGIAPALMIPLGTTAPMAPAAADLSETIAGLDSESVVLVAYEWGAQRSAELRSIEQPVIQSLVEQRAKMIILSTDLQGTLLSFDLREPLRAAGYNVEPDGRVFGGRDYVLLGYLPGGEIALRRVARDLRSTLTSDFIGQDATTGLVANNDDGSPRVVGVADLDMILVIADQAQDVQSWMEQVHFVAGDVPMTFLLPEEVRPQVQPYLRLPNVHYLAGTDDALAFAADNTTVDPGTIAQASGRQSLAVIAFLVLLLLGAIGSFVKRRSSAEVSRDR